MLICFLPQLPSGYPANKAFYSINKDTFFLNRGCAKDTVKIKQLVNPVTDSSDNQAGAALQGQVKVSCILSVNLLNYPFILLIPVLYTWW